MTDKDAQGTATNLSTLFVAGIVALAVLAVISMVGVFVYAPYYSFAQIQQAAEGNDQQRFEEYVDVAAIRASLKEELKEAMSAQIGTAEAITPEMLNLIADQYVAPMLEQAITAPNIMRLLTGAIPFHGTRRTAHAAEVLTGKESGPVIEKGYDGFNRFVVRAKEANGSAEVLFILMRDGLGWQLDEVRIPSLLKELQQKSMPTNAGAATAVAAPPK